MSDELEVEVEVPVTVEVEVDVNPEVEVEIELDAQPDIEVDANIEIDANVEIEIEMPDVEVEVELQAPDLEIEFQSPEIDVEVQVPVSGNFPADVKAELNTMEVAFEKMGNDIDMHMTMNMNSDLAQPLEVSVDAGGSSESISNHKMKHVMCLVLSIVGFLGMLAFILTAARSMQGLNVNYTLLGWFIALAIVCSAAGIFGLICAIKGWPKGEKKEVKWEAPDLTYNPPKCKDFEIGGKGNRADVVVELEINTDTELVSEKAGLDFELGIDGPIIVELEEPEIQVEVEIPEHTLEVEIEAPIEVEVEIEAPEVEVDAVIEVEVEVEG